MFDLTPLFEFSRNHCVEICTFLVPANLLATLQTILLVGGDRPSPQIHLMAATSSFYALIMVMHVWTWFMIGVVMVPTFVLLGLGCVCLVTNVWAIAHPGSMANLLKRLAGIVFGGEQIMGNG